MLKRTLPIALVSGFASALSLLSQVAVASPWIDADDAYLRSSIQMLAQAGVVRGHLDTYPLMWSGIANDLRNVNVEALTDAERYAYDRLTAALSFARRSGVTGAKLTTVNDAAAVRGFGSNYREQAGLHVSRSFTGDAVAARLSTQARYQSADSNRYTFDGSYLATVLGNWSLSADQVPTWWGPGQDTALVLSSQARPIQALRVNRLSDEASSLPGLERLGRWHATAFVGRSQSAGPYGDHEIAGSRITLRPYKRLQIGASYMHQWGGDASVASLPEWPFLDASPGSRNRIAAGDIRLMLPQGIGLYGEFAERVGDSRVAGTSGAWLAGVETFFHGQERLGHVFVELSDVPAFFYSDRIDPQGYRRWGEPLAARQDQDSTTASIGYRFQKPSGHGWQLTIRQQTLGEHNPVVAEFSTTDAAWQIKRMQAQGQYQAPLGYGLMRFGLQYTRDAVDQISGASRTEHDIAVSASLEVRL